MTRRITGLLLFLFVICSLYAQQAPPIPGLVGYWPMNGNANDASSGGRNGSVSGASPTTDRHGDPGGAFHFDGDNDRITLPSDLTLDLDQGFTISSWHKIASNEKTSWSAYIGKSLSEGGKMMFHNSGNVTFYQDFNNPKYFIWTSGVNLGDDMPFDDWFHLALVVKRRPDDNSSGYENMNVKVYINGVLKAENNNMDATPDFDVFKILYLGRVQNRYYEGMLDDVAVFNQPLNDYQIQNLGTYEPSDATWITNNNGLYFNSGNVAIGTTETTVDGTTYQLAVNGKISTKEINVTVNNWPDYVFAPDYSLESLESVEEFIQFNHHLPGVPSAAVVEEKGAQLGEMNTILLRKIEELTLHLIEMNKEVGSLKASNEALMQEIDQLKKE